MKCSSEMLQNLQYFWSMKIKVARNEKKQKKKDILLFEFCYIIPKNIANNLILVFSEIFSLKSY